VRNLANGNVGASDFTRPGHIFPLIAREGGVLMRSGHTEAAVDLCRLANLPPVGVISELVNDDGTVMRGPAGGGLRREERLEAGLRRRSHRLPPAQGDADRARRDASTIETPGGPAKAHAYTLPWDPMQHLAVVFGDIRDGCRHAGAAASRKCRPRRFRRGAASLTHHEDDGRGRRGVIVYLREGSVGVGHRDRNRPAQDGEGHDEARRRENEWREIGLGAQILKDLGISSIRLLASRERHYVGLEGFGIGIAGTEII
jgi:3,4-dihydroxy 2-butanone 4-phosphate synthase/GTP cyclohydrolase II